MVSQGKVRKVSFMKSAPVLSQVLSHLHTDVSYPQLKTMQHQYPLWLGLSNDINESYGNCYLFAVRFGELYFLVNYDIVLADVFESGINV